MGSATAVHVPQVNPHATADLDDGGPQPQPRHFEVDPEVDDYVQRLDTQHARVLPAALVTAVLATSSIH